MRSSVLLVLFSLGCGEPAGTTSSAPGREVTSSQPSHQASTAPSAKQERHTSRYVDAMRRMAARPAEERRQFAAAAIAEVTEGSLLEPLRKGFQEVSQVEPRMGRLVLMKALASPEVATAWSAVCPAGPGALADMAKLRPEQQSSHLWSTCTLRGHGLITEAEAQKTDGVSLAAALTAASLLGKNEDARDLLAFFLKASPAASGL